MATRDGRIEQQMDGWIRAARCQKIKWLRGMGIGQTRTLGDLPGFVAKPKQDLFYVIFEKGKFKL